MNVNLKLIGALTATLALAGCHHAETSGTETSDAATSATSSSGMEQGAVGVATPGSEQDLAQNVGDRVFFALDKSDLSQEARQTLDRQAGGLQGFPAARRTL